MLCKNSNHKICKLYFLFVFYFFISFSYFFHICPDRYMSMKYWFLKENHVVQRTGLNVSLGIMIIMTLDHYV